MVDDIDCQRPLPLPPYLVTFRPAPDVASLPADVPPADNRQRHRLIFALAVTSEASFDNVKSPSQSWPEGARGVLLAGVAAQR